MFARMNNDAAGPVRRFYRTQARIYDLTRWAVLYGRRRAVDRLEIQPDHDVLEIGCGTGLNLRHVLARLDPTRGTLTGLDFSPHMLARAHRRVARHAWRNVELIEADAAAMNLGRTFDRLLIAYSLSMIPDWQQALRCARDHLADDGRLVILDFGTFRSWGPLAPAIRAWLRLHHVTVDRPWPDFMRKEFRRAEVHTCLGGYYIIVAAEK